MTKIKRKIITKKPTGLIIQRASSDGLHVSTESTTPFHSDKNTPKISLNYVGGLSKGFRSNFDENSNSDK